MVLQKRKRYEFNGFRVPNVPRGSRSMRGKRCVKRKGLEKVSGDEMYAFELLASVAGELLLEKESMNRKEKETGIDQKIHDHEAGRFSGSIVIISDPSDGSRKPSDFSHSDYKPQRDVDRRIRKLLASKYWKVSDREEDVKPLICGRKMCYKRQRTQNLGPFEERRLLEGGSLSSSDLAGSGDRFPCSPEIQVKREEDSSDTIVHGGNGGTPSPPAQKFTFNSDDYHVKLRIKSFKVPELFIEIPETATVGSLKRTVMEAVTAILEGGLRIGVHMQGKKVRDDDKTLLQAGISHSDELDSLLGFTIEPNSLPSPKPKLQEEPALAVPICDAPEPLDRLSPEAESKALVALPNADVEALALFPVDGKRRRSETGQRRVRRPFSVTEVEALVRAVEELGTGRWRDVKVCAFDGSMHRTYVDLKDKWKTLVHTARIPPQRRRGEQVPQELLDRVLSAHARWAHLQHPQPGSLFSPPAHYPTSSSASASTSASAPGEEVNAHLLPVQSQPTPL